MEIATKQDVLELERKLEQAKSDMLRAIEGIGKPKRMTSEDCAKEWGVTPKTAIRRLKRLQARGEVTDIDLDSRPITVNRNQFYEAL